MLCPAPVPEGERTHLLTTLLVEQSHVVIPKGSKPQKGRMGLQTRETSITRSEDTHASSTHEHDVEEVKEVQNPSLKGKREAFEDTEDEARPKGQKRVCKVSADPQASLLRRRRAPSPMSQTMTSSRWEGRSTRPGGISLSLCVVFLSIEVELTRVIFLQSAEGGPQLQHLEWAFAHQRHAGSRHSSSYSGGAGGGDVQFGTPGQHNVGRRTSRHGRG